MYELYKRLVRANDFLKAVLLIASVVFSGLALAAGKQCLGCHADQVPVVNLLRNIHGQLPSTASGSTAVCQSCHGESAAHRANPLSNPVDQRFGKDYPAEQQSDVCQGCHTGGTQKHWAISEHASAGIACTGCHSVHAAKDRVMIRGEQQEVCYGCHRDKRADSTKFSRHPIREGELSCTSCHDTHGGKGPSMLREATTNETCYLCHTEKRGPFLWEHEPVQDDCTNCHTPHGSVNDNMLIVRVPFLCQQCHIDSGHRGTNYGVGNVVEDSHAYSKGCLNCHGEIHGSNHVSGGAYFE